MKVTRKMLLTIIAALGVLLIASGIINYFTGFSLGETGSRYFADIIIFAALGLFIYNRKLLKDEKAKEAAEKAERRTEEGEEEASANNENPPH